MAKFNVTLSIGFPSARRHGEIEIPDEELEGLSEQEREDVIQPYVHDWAHQYIEFWAEPQEDE